MKKNNVVNCFQRKFSLVHFPPVLGTFNEFDAGKMILLQTNNYGGYINETTLGMYMTKITAPSIFTRLKIIRQINRIHLILKWKICYKDTVVYPPSD